MVASSKLIIVQLGSPKLHQLLQAHKQPSNLPHGSQSHTGDHWSMNICLLTTAGSSDPEAGVEQNSAPVVDEHLGKELDYDVPTDDCGAARSFNFTVRE